MALCGSRSQLQRWVARARRIISLCDCFETGSSVELDVSDASSPENLSMLEINSISGTLSEKSDESEYTPTSTSLDNGFEYRVQFVCIDSDLYIANRARKYMNYFEMRSVIYNQDAHDGGMDAPQIGEFTSKSMWNVIIVSPKSFQDELFQYQVALAVSISIHKGVQNVVIVHARKDVSNDLPPMLLTAKQVKGNDGNMWLSKLTKVLSHPPLQLMQVEKPRSFHQTLSDTKLSLSDETLRVNRANEADKSPRNLLRDTTRLQHIKNISQNFQVIPDKKKGLKVQPRPLCSLSAASSL